MEFIKMVATTQDTNSNGQIVEQEAFKPLTNSFTKGDMNGETSLKTFSRLPKTKPIDLRFDSLGYTATVGIRRDKKKILHDIYGRFLPSQLIAIMGPSGAGKSTLLDILSGYRITGVSGRVMVDGIVRNLNEFRRKSCYITQDDRLQPLLTVLENMWIAADLKLGSLATHQEKHNIIEEILTTLGLDSTKKTKAAMLSGGQKKRLSIALELVNNPLVMFLDEPTTGLDSSSCTQCIQLLQQLAQQGRTIVCTIHQPSASLFEKFDHVYILAEGRCVYQGSTKQLVPFLSAIGLDCPQYHNPADYVIELACGDYGSDKLELMVAGTENGRSLEWFENANAIQNSPSSHYDMDNIDTKSAGPSVIVSMLCGGGCCRSGGESLQETSQWNQFKVLMRRGFIRMKRDTAMTHMRVFANIIVGILLGILYFQIGNDGSRVRDNYNMIFSVLVHHMCSNMMLTILTFPSEMLVLQKEHFNRWYSLKCFYISTTILDIPMSILSCMLCSAIVYVMTGQLWDFHRLVIYLIICQLTMFIAQGIGLMIGAMCSVTNGTFVGPVLWVPFMMFAGFGITLRDMPSYLDWGTHISFLRYALEGLVGALYGFNRGVLDCFERYCHYRYPKKFLQDIAMATDQYGNDIMALIIIVILLRTFAYFCLRWKLYSSR